MKTTLGWLKEHLETDAPLGVIADRLIMLGHDLEGVENRAAGLEQFTVAFVISAERHPNADRLKVCVVDTGKDRVQVVCGAPNAHTGMKGVFVPAGTVIPRTGALLNDTVIRGVASRGMLCSAYELALGDDHEGIIELPEDAPIGTPYASFIGLGDPVFDIKVTPNRADCLGVRGIARDLAAARLGCLKPLDAAPVPGRFRSPISIRIEDYSACPRAADIDLGRRLGKREIARPEADRQVVHAKKGAAEFDQAAFEMSHMGRPVDDQPLDLVEHRRMRCIVVTAERPPGNDDPDRRLLRQHRADLHRRGMRAQHEPGAVGPLRQIKRVVFLPCRMLRRYVERREVIEILLDMRAFGDHETHFAKDRDNLVHRLTNRMNASGSCVRDRESNVGTLDGEPFFERRASEPRSRLGERRCDPVPGHVQSGARLAPLLRLQRAQFAHRQRQGATPTEDPDANLL